MKKKEAMTRMLDNYIDDSDPSADNNGHSNMKRMRRDSYTDVNNEDMSMLNDDNLVKQDGETATAYSVWKEDPFKKILNLKEGN